jgi:hypothetical protein
MSSLAKRMNQILLHASQQAEADELEPIQKLIDEAVKGQRSVVEELIDSKAVDEEKFMAALAHQMKMPWEADLKPRNSRRLKEICSPQIAPTALVVWGKRSWHHLGGR